MLAFYKSTRGYKPEIQHRRFRCCENLKSYKISKVRLIFNLQLTIKMFCTIYIYIYIYIHSSKVRPLYSGFPSPKTKLRHLSLSLVSSSVSPWFVMLRLTPSIHRSLGLPLLHLLLKSSSAPPLPL
jgi:hypothetical protein